MAVAAGERAKEAPKPNSLYSGRTAGRAEETSQRPQWSQRLWQENKLRQVLQTAGLKWGPKDLAAVEEKLARIDVRSVGALSQLLRAGTLNRELSSAGLRPLARDSAAALRERLARDDVAPYLAIGTTPTAVQKGEGPTVPVGTTLAAARKGENPSAPRPFPQLGVAHPATAVRSLQEVLRSSWPDCSPSELFVIERQVAQLGVRTPEALAWRLQADERFRRTALGDLSAAKLESLQQRIAELKVVAPPVVSAASSSTAPLEPTHRGQADAARAVAASTGTRSLGKQQPPQSQPQPSQEEDVEAEWVVVCPSVTLRAAPTAKSIARGRALWGQVLKGVVIERGGESWLHMKPFEKRRAALCAPLRGDDGRPHLVPLASGEGAAAPLVKATEAPIDGSGAGLASSLEEEEEALEASDVDRATSPAVRVEETEASDADRSARTSAPRVEETEVCIIGAGLAGLAAAQVLARLGVGSVVLEARGRAGGRAKTVQLGRGEERSSKESKKQAREGSKLRTDLQPVFVDCGPNYLHACGDPAEQPLFGLCWRLGIPTAVAAGDEGSRQWGWASVETADWHLLGPFRQAGGMKAVAQTILLYERAMARCCLAARRHSSPQTVALASFFEEAVAELGCPQATLADSDLPAPTVGPAQLLAGLRARRLGYVCPTERTPLSQALRQPWPAAVERGFHERAFPETPEGRAQLVRLELSLEKRWHQVTQDDERRIRVATEPDIHDEDRLVLGEGFGRIVTWLQAGVDLRLGHRVTAVQYQGPGVTVQAESEGDMLEFRCRLCLVTVPVGVLKCLSPESTIDFDPPLPAAKVAAIARLAIPEAGTPTHEKVFLRFASEDIFWDVTAPHIASSDPRFTITNLHRLGKRGVLIAHIWAEGKLDTREMSDEAVVAEVLEALREVWSWLRADDSQKAMPEPMQWLVTRWSADPFTLGSYSAPELGSVAADYQAYAAPLMRSSRALPGLQDQDSDGASAGPEGTWFFNGGKSCYTISAASAAEAGAEDPAAAELHFFQGLAGGAVLRGPLARVPQAEGASGRWTWEASLSNRARVRLRRDGPVMVSSYLPKGSREWNRPCRARRRPGGSAEGLPGQASEPLVFFAGEACARSLRQTAGGAFVSGARAALEMARHLPGHEPRAPAAAADAEIMQDLAEFLWPSHDGYVPCKPES